MATTIKLKNSVTTTNAPSSLVQGEVAINITDKKVWVGNAATTPVQLLGDGASLNFTSLTLSANLNFTGTGNRITGDMSNATVANRVAFQTSTANSSTSLTVIPNGTSNTSNLNLENSSTPLNNSVMQVSVDSTLAYVISGIRGTGTYLPLVMYTGGSERLRIDTSGNVGIGTNNAGDKLTIVGAPSTYINVQSTNASTGSGLYTSNATRSYLIGAGAASGNSNLEFRDVTAGATRLFLDTSGNLQLNTAGTKIFNSSGNPILQQTGSIVQVVNNAVSIGTVSTTSTSYVDITNATATITPTSSTNKILVLWSCFGSNSLVAATNVQYLQILLRGATTLYTEQIAAESGSGGLQIASTFAITYLDSPATTSATTYKMQHRTSNASSTGTANGGNLILMEIVA